MKYNPKQEKALKEIKKHLGLSAGAGTGKTAVLTGRYLNILQNGNFIGENKSQEIVAITFTKLAAEEMLGKIIRTLASQEGKGEFQNYDLKVSTIHSFCEDLLRTYSIYLDLNQDFEILDEDKKPVYMKKSADKIMDDLKDIPEIKEMAKQLDIANPFSFKEVITDFYEYMRSLGYGVEEVEKLSRKTKLGSFSNLMSCLKKLENEKKMRKFQAFTKTSAYEDIKSSKLTRDNLLELVESMKSSKNTLKNICQDEIFKILSDIEDPKEGLYEIFFEALKQFERTYIEQKTQENLLDFEDLQIFVLKLMEDEKIAKKIRNKISYLMVDEFQDINRTQRLLFLKLTENLTNHINFFVVGDEKQAIYGFRGSDIDEFKLTTRAIENSGGLLLNLDDNYRTEKGLMDKLNKIFAGLMENYKALLAANEKYSKDDLLVLDFDAEDLSAEEIREKEAYVIADYIKSLSNIAYEDVAVISRSAINFKSLAAAFDAKKIPYKIKKSESMDEIKEISDFKNLLKLLLIGDDPYLMAAYLLSDFVCLFPSSLKLYFEKGEEVYKSLKDSEGEKLRKGLENLEFFRSLPSEMNLVDMLDEIVKRSNYLENLSVKARGESRLKNVEYFLKLPYEVGKDTSLLEFVEILENKKEMNLDDGKSGVNILTIHGSKGLEYDVVIIPASYKKSGGKNTEKVNFSKEIGLGIRFEGAGRFEINSKIKSLREFEEEIRIFYVAATRAKKNLVFTRPLNPKLPEENSYLDMMLKSGVDFSVSKIEPAKVEKDEKLTKDLSEPIEDSENAFLKKISKQEGRFYTVTAYLKHINKKETAEMEERKSTKSVLNPGLYGSLVHKFISLYKGVDHERLMKNILKASFLEESLYRFFENQIENYVSYFYKDCKKTHELEIHLKTKNGNLYGILDEVRFYDDHLELIDYKTNRKGSPEELSDYYKSQLRLYAYALKKIYKKEVLAKLIFLSKNVCKIIDTDEASLEMEIKNFDDFIREEG